MENTKCKFYQKDWFLWLSLIIFTPIGLILLWTCHKNKNTRAKINLSAMFITWFIIYTLMVLVGQVGSTDDMLRIEQQAQSSEEESQVHIDSKFDKINFSVRKVPNDVTGNWRISAIAENIEIQNYALDYYKKYFNDDKEIHGIVNFNYNTTTRIFVIGNLIEVAVHEYVKGEEHNANILFGGPLLEQYHINIEDGTIEKIQ